MAIKSSKHQLVEVAGTQYVRKPVRGKTTKQLRAEALNSKAQAKYLMQVMQAKLREEKSGITEVVPDPPMPIGAPVPNTLVRVTHKKSQHVAGKTGYWNSKEALRLLIKEGSELGYSVDMYLDKLVA